MTAAHVTEVAIKVDVDTHDGAREGIPRLAGIFREAGIAASFFVSIAYMCWADRRKILTIRDGQAVIAPPAGVRDRKSGFMLPARRS